MNFEEIKLIHKTEFCYVLKKSFFLNSFSCFLSSKIGFDRFSWCRWESEIFFGDLFWLNSLEFNSSSYELKLPPFLIVPSHENREEENWFWGRISLHVNSNGVVKASNYMVVLCNFKANEFVKLLTPELIES